MAAIPHIEHSTAPQRPSGKFSQQSSAPTTRDESASDADASVQIPAQSYNPSNMDVGDEPTAPESGSNNSNALEPFNQDLIKAEDNADTIKTHLCGYYFHSRWMSSCFFFVWLQLLSVTTVSFLFLSVTRPSPILVQLVFVILFLQPIELFSVITFGLYMTDRQNSKIYVFSIVILYLLLLALTTSVCFMLFLRVPFEPKPLALAPLTLLVGLSFCLNWVK